MEDGSTKQETNSLTLSVIGIVHSPFKSLDNMPIQPLGGTAAMGEVVVEAAFTDGLRDLDGFSHIYLLYYFHRAVRIELSVTPYLDTVSHGVFATRSPLRPAHLGLSIVELLEVVQNRLVVRGLDILDGTPLLDIKPYVPHFDCHANATSGWLQTTSSAEIAKKRSDQRFI